MTDAATHDPSRLADSRPNLLLFMPDQLRADAVGCFGSPVAKTPTIDALTSAWPAGA